MLDVKQGEMLLCWHECLLCSLHFFIWSAEVVCDNGLAKY